MTKSKPTAAHTETAEAILAEIKPWGAESYRKVLFNHGIKEPCYGVKISDLKKIQKRIKNDYRLALDLYDTGVYDAMYLASLIADDARMTKKDLQRWMARAYCRPLAGWTVPSVAAGSPHGWEVALEWIESDRPLMAAGGWSTLTSLVSIKADTGLDLAALERLLERVRRTIHQSSDGVRYSMNYFVIGVGCYVKPLMDAALRAAEKIGKVTADLGDNECQVPDAVGYIRKVEARGTIGRKRKSAKC